MYIYIYLDAGSRMIKFLMKKNENTSFLASLSKRSRVWRVSKFKKASKMVYWDVPPRRVPKHPRRGQVLGKYFPFMRKAHSPAHMEGGALLFTCAFLFACGDKDIVGSLLGICQAQDSSDLCLYLVNGELCNLKSTSFVFRNLIYSQASDFLSFSPSARLL